MSAGHRNHRQLVASASITTLVDVLNPFPLAVVTFDDDDVWFPCPRCQTDAVMDGAAHIVNAWRWTCLHCQCSGTRYELEDLVLFDGDALDRLVWEMAEARR